MNLKFRTIIAELQHEFTRRIGEETDGDEEFNYVRMAISRHLTGGLEKWLYERVKQQIEEEKNEG